ncbi:MAG: TetR/AcrR family transcriptional regulator [Alphaproteobacteria bacterium]|nr:TetR/AcrR family transcriptional regulator [Alphaproteobacteria bacterium]
MGRRPKHSKAEFQNIALAAAQAIIAEEGLQSLNVRAVAARMGCSVGTIYNFFAGIEELVALVNAETLDALHDKLSQAPVTGRPEHDLHVLLDLYLQFVGERECSWILLFEERLPEAKEPPDWYFEKIARLFTLLARILEPLFRPDQEAELARAVRLIWISLHGVWSLNARGHLSIVTVDPLATIAHSMVDTYLAGLRAGTG